MTSQIKVYDIEGYEDTSMHPFHVPNLHKLIRYINTGVITHFTFTKSKRLHDYTNLNDMEKIRYISKYRTVTKRMLKFAEPEYMLFLYNLAGKITLSALEKETARKQINKRFF